jgi:hypothetical protein
MNNNNNTSLINPLKCTYRYPVDQEESGLQRTQPEIIMDDFNGIHIIPIVNFIV